MKLIIAAAVLILTNLTCFLLMRYDKMQARKGKRRIPESTLFLSAGLFGAIGGVLAMQIYRHKTKHWNFRSFFPLMMIAQIAVIGYAAGRWLL